MTSELVWVCRDCMVALEKRVLLATEDGVEVEAEWICPQCGERRGYVYRDPVDGELDLGL